MRRVDTVSSGLEDLHWGAAGRWAWAWIDRQARPPSCDCGRCAVLSPAPAMYSRRRGPWMTGPDASDGRLHSGRDSTWAALRVAGSSRSRARREPARRPRRRALAEHLEAARPGRPRHPRARRHLARRTSPRGAPGADRSGLPDRSADGRAPLQRRPPPARDRGHPAGAGRGPDRSSAPASPTRRSPTRATAPASRSRRCARSRRPRPTACRPDLTIVLDVPVEVGLARKAPGDVTRFEAEFDLAFHRRVRDGFLALAAAEPERFVGRRRGSPRVGGGARRGRARPTGWPSPMNRNTPRCAQRDDTGGRAAPAPRFIRDGRGGPGRARASGRRRARCSRGPV